MNLNKNNVDWEYYYQQWLILLKERRHNDAKKIEIKIRQIFNNQKLDDLDWVITVLDRTSNQNKRTGFILNALKGTQMPYLLFEPLLKAAVYETDPSTNKLFIVPCLRCFGIKKVNLRLIEYFTNGSNREKAGAASAFYWSFILNKNDKITKEEILELHKNLNIMMLKEFVHNSNTSVQQRIIPQLQVDPKYYPLELVSLLQKAITIAKSHPDEYIRHRIEIQLGSRQPLKAIP